MNPDDPTLEGKLAEQLRQLLLAIEASGQAVLPRSSDELLKSIVEAAARIFGAAAASLALVDEKKQTLEFKVSVGAGNENVVGMSIPLDKGIAGYVAMTGQPIAISNVMQDARFNQDFAKSTGYVPRSILATPLLLGERVIGVMEVLDKISAPSFGLQDMELLGMFAHQAAIAIAQSQQIEKLDEALVSGLKKLVLPEAGAEPGSEPSEGSAAFLAALKGDGEDTVRAREILALADLFNEIGALGEAERKACLRVLAAFADYGRSKRRLFL